MGRPYYALNGKEVVDIITSEVRRKLESSARFTQARSFPQVSWKWTLEIEAYPADRGAEKVEALGNEKRSEPEHPAEKVELYDGRKGIGVSVAPDQVRTEEGMPISEPKRSEGGSMVDDLISSLSSRK